MSDARAPSRSRIKELEVMVADTVQETADTTTLVFFTGNDRLDYKAGHFLTIDPHQFEPLERFIAFLEDLKGRKEPPRAYSMVSAPHERYLAVTVVQNPDRLRVVHALTRETRKEARDADVRSGRVSLALLKELVPDPSAPILYACGPAISQWDRLATKEAGRTPPPRFMETVLGLLRELGVPADRIHRESYG